jgi:phosphoglycolate phosphatase
MDMIGAQENGVHSVGALYGYGSKEELSESGAEYIIEKPIDLIEIVLGKDGE